MMTREKVNGLVKQAQQGDDRAFGELFNGFWHYVFGYAFRQTDNFDDAEEIAQSAFIAAWLGIRKFDTEKNASFQTWLCGIARKEYLMLRRKRTGKASIPRTYTGTECLNNLADGSDTPETSIIRHDEDAIQDATVERVLFHASGLPPQQNLAFRLKHLEGLNMEDIKKITGMTPAQINRYGSLGIKNIRKCFEKFTELQNYRIKIKKMDKKFWTEDIGLKSYGWSDKLRIYWLVLSLVVLGCVADAPWWLSVLLLGNFAASAISLGKVEFKDDGKI